MVTPVSCLRLPSQGKYAEAEQLYERAHEILLKSSGQDHRKVATVLLNRAAFLASLVRAIRFSKEFSYGHHLLKIWKVWWDLCLTRPRCLLQRANAMS